MHIIRSTFFNAVFFAITGIALFLGTPLRFFHKRYVFIFWRYLSLVLNFISAKVSGISFVIKNEHNLLNKPAIYAVHHESIWETLILIHKFKEPVLILKKELLRIPLFGEMARKTGAIEVDRDNGIKALIDAVSRVEKSIKEGHPVVIFPEGTRTSPGKYVPLKRGIALFYSQVDCPVVPVIHNSGSFWPRRGFLKKPGEIQLTFLEPIPPGLSKNEFMDKLNYTFRTEIEKMKQQER